MRVKIKNYLKRQVPVVFLFLQNLNNLKRRFKRLLSYNLPIKINFLTVILRDKPYFGINYTANQVWPERKPIMESLIDDEIKRSNDRPFKALEIGTWGGASAVLWAQACKRNNNGVVYCIDTWKGAKNILEGDDHEIRRGIKKDRIVKLFLHNIRTSGLQDYIIPIRASSDQMANMLQLNSFNFIYLDGDHDYDQTLKDLINYTKLLKTGGIICGDDYELSLSRIDLGHAKANSEKDFVTDPETGEQFHPGITLAIAEVFGDVSMKNGFWAIRKTDSGWEKVNLDFSQNYV